MLRTAKKVSSKVMKAIISLVILLCLSTAVSAEILSLSIDQNFSNCNNQSYQKDSLKVSYTDFIYNTDTQQLTIEAEFNNQGGTTLANSFQLSFNSETALETSRYKLAYFYIDGSGSTFANGNIATPKVSALILS